MFRFNKLSTSKKSRTSRQPQMESLENRALMAGDVSASLIGTQLYVNEGANGLNSSNQVQVSQLSNGKVRVSGYTNNANPSRINGLAFVDFAIPGGAGATNLIVNLRGGNDRLALWNANLGTVNINMSSTAPGAADIDTVDIQNLRTKGAVQISTGEGVDNVFVMNSHIGDGIGADDLTIRTGRGSDTVKVGNTSNWSDVRGSLNIKTYDTLSETDVDSVIVQLTTVYKTGVIDLGGGDDKFELLADTFGDDLIVFGGAGADTGRMTEVQVIDDLLASMGEGNDSLDLNYVRADEMSLNGDAGFDKLIKSADSRSRLLHTSGWETVNGRYVVNQDLGGVAVLNRV